MVGRLPLDRLRHKPVRITATVATRAPLERVDAILGRGKDLRAEQADGWVLVKLSPPWLAKKAAKQLRLAGYETEVR